MAGSLTDITEGKVADALDRPAQPASSSSTASSAPSSGRGGIPESRFAVLFLDLDRFKVVNDSLGHLVGDQLLIAFARRLEGCLRATDTVSPASAEHTIARLGGDEFTILLDGINGPGDAIRVAERIQTALAVPFDLGGHEVFTTRQHRHRPGRAPATSRPEDLLRDADTAMYEAKAQGKARSEVFDAAMRARAVARLQLETELRRALERRRVLPALPAHPVARDRPPDRLRGPAALAAPASAASSPRTSSSRSPRRPG